MADDLLRRHFGQDVVDVAEDEAAVLPQIAGHLARLAIDILDASQQQRALCVDPAAPQGEPTARLVLPLPIRMAAGRPLHRIERVEAGLDDHVEQVVDRAAGMEEGLYLRCQAMALVVDPLAIGQEKRAKDLGRGDERLLCAPIVAGQPDDIYVVPHFRQKRADVLEGELGDDLVQLGHVIGLGEAQDGEDRQAAPTADADRRHDRALVEEDRPVGGVPHAATEFPDLDDLLVAQLVRRQRLLQRLQVHLRQIVAQVERLAAVQLVEDIGGGRHTPAALHDRAVRLGDEGGRMAHQGRQAAVEVVGRPLLGLVEGVGGPAADGHDVHAQRIQHIEVGHGEHLDGVVHLRRPGRQAERGHQPGIGEAADARRQHPAEVLRRPIGHLEVERFHDAFARGKQESLLRWRD